jgi:hypothetical protein
MEAGLEMRVHDPLWMLARQWQFGEFMGEDAGSPVWAAFSGVESPIAFYLPGPIEAHQSDQVQDYSPDTPLEWLVEDERLPARDVMLANRRVAVEAGQHFLRLLGAPLAADHRSELLKDHAVAPLTAAERAEADPESVAFMDLVAGRALDGARLLAVIGDFTPKDAATVLGFKGSDNSEAAQAIGGWLTWCAQTIGSVAPKSEARSAWNPERMEYSCALAAPDRRAGGQSVLVAREYHGGRLDWFSFDMAQGAQLKRNLTAQGRSFTGATLPTGLSFRGMPANRLWEFEDAQVRFGSIEAGPTDLARILLVGFLIEYGNDFFTIPLGIETGALVRIDSLTVTNAFGDVTSATPFADKEWRLFTLSSDDAVSPNMASTLFLPPVLGQRLASPPLEQVELVRDEMANIAWAIERVVQSKAGGPLNRHEAYQARRQREAGDRQPQAGRLVYRLDTWQSSRPDFWIPLLPEQAPPGEPTARLVCYDQQGQSRGQLLSEKRGGSRLYVFAEEIPRGGAHVRRMHQYTRWYDGRLFTWIGREKRPGRGGASSGLRYDAVEIATKS